MSTYYFIGVGGSGMSAIAQLLAGDGHRVLGSDRNYDRGLNSAFFKMLADAGVTLCAQDGAGVTPGVDAVVVSTAIEDSVPDMKRARELGLAVKHRAEMLAEIFNGRTGVAVGGTSGKSTVTGMIGFILSAAGLDPSVINGGRIKNFASATSPGNTRLGRSDIIVVESDESDGSIVHYKPEVAIVTNISLDHKSIPELRSLFDTFIRNTRGLCVINADCPEASTLNTSGRLVTRFSLRGDADIVAEDVNLESFGSAFTVDGLRWKLNVPGMHNVANALAAVAACRHFDVPDAASRRALEDFTGIGRRFDVVGTAGGVTVIDDFGHNPDKIRATLETLALSGRRRLLVFQPHGFGPTLFMKDGLIKVFSEYMRDEDMLFMPEIFYAGGTADRRISSSDITGAVAAAGKHAHFTPKREDLVPLVVDKAQNGDVVAVMGARDDTLPAFCGTILSALEAKFAS